MGHAESPIEKYLVACCKDRRYYCMKMSVDLYRGMPDRLVIGNNHVIFVELKSSTGRLSKTQEVRHEELRRLGANVRVINSIEDVDAFIKDIDRPTGDRHATA